MTTTTRRATHKDGAAAEAMLKADRTTTTTALRRCTGSTRFGIEPHEAPIEDFPVQPSRKDGLGTMCDPHWKAYVKGLAADRKAHQGVEAFASASTAAIAVDAAIAREAKKMKRARTAKAPDPKVTAAETLIAEVDALPAPEMVKRVGDDDVQAAIETVAASNGHGHETPLGETIDGGTEEADAA